MSSAHIKITSIWITERHRFCRARRNVIKTSLRAVVTHFGKTVNVPKGINACSIMSKTITRGNLPLNLNLNQVLFVNPLVLSHPKRKTLLSNGEPHPVVNKIDPGVGIGTKPENATIPIVIFGMGRFAFGGARVNV